MTTNESARLTAALNVQTEVNLNGWDIVNAGTFTPVNNAIEKQVSTPSNFELADQPPGIASLTGGEWDTWKLVPGSAGKSIAIEMPIKSGTASEITMPLTYATFDPSTKGNVDISQNGLTLTTVDGETSVESAFSTVSQTAGKFYFEIRNDYAGTGQSPAVFVGITSTINTNTKSNFSSSPTSYGIRSSDGTLFNGLARTSAPAGTTDRRWRDNGDIIGIAVDLDEKKIWFRGTDDKWIGNGADPATGDVPAYQNIDTSNPIFVATAIDAGGAATINLDGKSWTYKTPPDGFTPGLIDRAKSTVSVNLAGGVVSATITFKQEKSTNSAMKLIAEDVGTVATPAVSVSQVTLGDGTVATGQVSQAFDTVLNEQIKKFTNVFHIIKPTSANGAAPMKWMAPTLTDYAAADLTDDKGDVMNSVLAILNQTSANKSTTPGIAQVDPAIIANLPKNSAGKVLANAVVAISPERLTEQILLPGAAALIENGATSNFKIDNLNRNVTNIADEKFGPIKLKTKAGSPDLEVNPIIPAGGLKMSIDGRSILIQYRELHFPYDNVALDKQETISFGFDQRLYLESKERDDGHHILFPTTEDPQNPSSNPNKVSSGMTNFNISMNLTQGQIAKDKQDAGSSTALIIGLVIGGVVLFAIAGGVAVWACSNGAEAVAADAAGAAAAAGDGVGDVDMPEQIYGVFNLADANQYDVVNAADMAGVYDAPASPFTMFLEDGTRVFGAKPKTVLPAGSMPFKAKWAVGFSHLMTMADTDKASDLGMTEAQIKKFAEGNFNIPGIEATIEKFVERVLKPFDWPQTKGWTFVDVELNGSLLIYGNIVSDT